MQETGVSPILVGRTREMELLNRALHAAQDGAGGCILLAGEAGIGKSRLAAELNDHATSAHFLVLQGYCSEQDSSFPYAPWIDALRAFLAPRGAAEANAWLGPTASEFVKLLPELSLTVPTIQPTPPLDPIAEKQRLFGSLVHFATSLATTRPLLIILEDLHWSDEQSLELIQFLVRHIARIPILILGTYRNEDTPGRIAHHIAELKRSRRVEEIQLSPLEPADISRMIQAILQANDPIRPDWLDLLVPLTEGNPFFVEEITKSLVEAEARADQWAPLQIPRSIQHTVWRRVEELPERTRRALSMAAVIGERFDFALLQEVAAEDEQSLLHMLKELIIAQLIVEQSAEQFAFRHALTREVVYTSLMLRERKAMHQTIGEKMEHFARAHADSAAAPLAYHFYQAGDWQKAMEYSQRAGEEAQALYAPREALTHFTYAIDAAQHLQVAPPLSTLYGRGQSLEVLGEFDRARLDYETALELAGQGANHAGEWQALIDLGLLWQTRDLERAGEYYRRALVAARPLGDAPFLAQTLNRLGNWLMNRGSARQALPYHQEALEIFREAGDRRGMARTMDLLGIVSYQLGEVIQGAEYLEEAIPILRELDDRQGLVNTLVNLTVRAISDTEVLGDINYGQLTGLSDEALLIARGFHWHEGEIISLIQGAISLKQTGEYGQALQRLAQAHSMADESRNREAIARYHLITGEIYHELFALAEAKEHLETALASLQELGSGLLVFGARVNLATTAILQSDFAQAKTYLSDLLPGEYPVGGEGFSLRKCWCVWAELELSQGNPRGALAIADRLVAVAPGIDRYGPQAVPRLSRLRGNALAALSHLEEAERELKGTLSVALKRGQRPILWRLHADLGHLYRAMERRDDAEREFASARTVIQGLVNSLPEGALRNHFLKQALAMIPAVPILTPRQMAKKEFGGLTAREREIVVLIAQGKSNREIAGELVISKTTVERHVANIFSKLEFNSRTQIVVWAVEKGLGK